ncbi:MAG: hypothetical protein GY716_07385 [bacterium]|nr:hypothetical protein [bacterium]
MKMLGRGVRAAFALGALLIGSIVVAHAGPGAAVVSERIAVTSAGGRSSSLSFDNVASIGQSSPVGAASFCGAGYHASLGLWSIRGQIPVRNVLEVQRDPAIATEVELSWSGSDQKFEVYRSTSALNVTDPTNFDRSTRDCVITDPTSGLSDILFYKIVPKD